MRISELARQADLPVATVKFYLREGLLHPGELTSPNQSRYDHGHVERLRLIRALVAVARLPLSEVKRVVDALDGRSEPLETLGIVQDALVPEPTEPAADADRQHHDRAETLVTELVNGRGWGVPDDSPARRSAVSALAALLSSGAIGVADRLEAYADVADQVATLDVDSLPLPATEPEAETETAGDDPGDPLSRTADPMLTEMVLGTILRRPLFDGLVLLAQQHRAGRRFR